MFKKYRVLWLFLVLFLVLTAVIYQKLSRSSRVRGAASVPLPWTPKALFLGHIPQIFGKKNAMQWQMDEVLRTNRPLHYRFVMSYRVMPFHPIDVAYIFNHPKLFAKPEREYGRLEQLIGHGLVCITNDKEHLQVRRGVAPAFAPGTLRHM